MNKFNFMLKIVSVALALALVHLFGSKTSFASQFFGDITVSVETYPMTGSTHGYAEYRVSLTNDSPDKAHEVTLFIPGRSFRSGDHIGRLERSVVLNPSSSAKVSMLQPPLRILGQDMGVMIDGETQRDYVRLDSSQHCRFYFPRSVSLSTAMAPLCILTSRDVGIDQIDAGLTKIFGNPGASSYAPRMWQTAKSDLPLSAWSNNWLAYSCYDGIVVTASDMQSMPAPVNSALLQYVQCGGALLVLGGWDKPESWRSKEIFLGPFRLNYLRFGLCLVSDNPDPAAWEDDTWRKLTDTVWRATAAEMHRKAGMSIADANRDFPVVANLTMPVKGMFALVSLYALAIGPVNLLVLSHKKKRIWMLWIIPVVSVVACAAVVAYAFLAEGWRGYIRTGSVTILDENSLSATTLAMHGYYCPLTPRSGLHFDYETEVTPMGIEEVGGGRSRSIDWTIDQHFATGWVAARVPAHFLLRKSQMRRERVEIERAADDNIIALNGLGADIVQLWYADEKGRIHKGKDIPAGAKVVLSASAESVAPVVPSDLWRKTYNSNWAKGPDRIRANVQKYLRPGCYVAVLDDPVFAESALRSFKTKNFDEVVFGILKGSVDAG